MKRNLLIVLGFILLTSISCQTDFTQMLSEAERGKLSTSMVNLSASVDTYFSTLLSAPTEGDADILTKATSHDPDLLAPEFKSYLLKVSYQNTHAVLLLCSKAGNAALMEDAGCSARLDRQVTGSSPCEFTLKVSMDCQIEGGDAQ